MPVYEYQNLTYYIYNKLTALVSREKCIILDVSISTGEKRLKENQRKHDFEFFIRERCVALCTFYFRFG